MDENKIAITNDVDKANALGHEFAAVSRSANYPPDFCARKFTVDHQLSRSLPTYSTEENCMDQPFTLHELQKATVSRKKSSPSLDSVCYMKSKNLLNENQSDFWKGRNTLDRIISLHDFVHEAINHRSVIAFFLDIKRAYDMVWRNGLLSKLLLKGVSGRMIKWLNLFLQDRSFVVEVGGSISRAFSLENGIPKGSVLSESRSVAMLFTRWRNIGSLSLDIHGSPLTFVDNFKYLGVAFDANLSTETMSIPSSPNAAAR